MVTIAEATRGTRGTKVYTITGIVMGTITGIIMGTMSGITTTRVMRLILTMGLVHKHAWCRPGLRPKHRGHCPHRPHRPSRGS